MKGAVCLGVSFTLLRICRESCIADPVYLCQMTKAAFSPLWKLKSSNLKTARKTLWIIYITAKTLVELLSFLKEAGCLPPFAGNSSDITVFWSNQGNNRYGSQHSKNALPKHLFSWKWAVCPKCVFDTAWKLQQSHFCDPGYCAWWQKRFYFLPGKARNLRPQTPRRTLCFIYLFIKVKNLVNEVNFLKQDAFYYFLGSYQIVQFCLIRVITDMVVNTHKTLSLDIFTHERVQCVLGVSFYTAKKLQRKLL